MKQPTWHQTLGLLLLLLLGGCAGEQPYDLNTTICDGIADQDLGMDGSQIPMPS
jgi:hypothetical protein